MKKSTIILRRKFNQKKTTNRFRNWKKIQRWVYQLNRCAYCRKTLGGEVHIDHVSPLSHSKSQRINNYANLVISCKTCNRLKSDQTGVDYPEWINRRKRNYRYTPYSELIKLSEEIKHGFTNRH